MTLNVSKEMVAKLAAVGDTAILDSVFLKNGDGTSAEKTQGQQGVYISSETDGWNIRGPFALAL